MKKINLFVDMDGTIARFYEHPKCLEKMYEKNFFRNLKTYKILQGLRELAKEDNNITVYILSACVKNDYCQKEKQEWLNENFPEIPQKNRIFTFIGENKAKAIEEKIKPNEINILLDDYSQNLLEWQKVGYIPFKMVNEFNNTNNRFYHTIKNHKDLIKNLREVQK